MSEPIEPTTGLPHSQVEEQVKAVEYTLSDLAFSLEHGSYEPLSKADLASYLLVAYLNGYDTPGRRAFESGVEVFKAFSKQRSTTEHKEKE